MTLERHYKYQKRMRGDENESNKYVKKLYDFCYHRQERRIQIQCERT